MRSKFGDYATLDALAEQWRVQGGTFDLRVLTDGSPSKPKICQCLMIEKVVNRINELEETTFEASGNAQLHVGPHRGTGFQQGPQTLR